MRPTIQQLEAFLAVARTLNFRRAADESFTSQSALSAQIKRLEELLGVTLFERDRRRTRLTPEGERAHALALQVLQGIDALADAMRAEGDPLAGTVRVGVIPTIAPFLLPRFVKRLAAEHPASRVLFYEEPTSRLVTRMQAGEIDIAILDVDVDLANLRCQVLFEEALLVALSTGHALADRERLSLDDVADLDLLLLEEGHCLSARIRTFCRANDPQHAFGDFRATSIATLVQMVAAGVGVTLLPEMAARELATVPELRMIPFAPPAPTRRVGIAWRPTDRRERTFQRLAEIIEACG